MVHQAANTGMLEKPIPAYHPVGDHLEEVGLEGHGLLSKVDMEAHRLRKAAVVDLQVGDLLKVVVDLQAGDHLEEAAVVADLQAGDLQVEARVRLRTTRATYQLDGTLTPLDGGNQRLHRPIQAIGVHQAAAWVLHQLWVLQAATWVHPLVWAAWASRRACHHQEIMVLEDWRHCHHRVTPFPHLLRWHFQT